MEKKQKIRLYILSNNQEDETNNEINKKIENVIEELQNGKKQEEDNGEKQEENNGEKQEKGKDEYDNIKEKCDINLKKCDNKKKDSFISKTINLFLADIVVYNIGKKDVTEKKQERVLRKEINHILKFKHIKRRFLNKIQKVFLFTLYDDIKVDLKIKRIIEEEKEKIRKKYGDECDQYEVIPQTGHDSIRNTIKTSIISMIPVKEVSLFISCSNNSEDIKNDREKIKEKVTELNEKYANSREGKRINIIGYNDPESREGVFKDFIKKNADIVVFLIGKDNDKKQEEILINEIEFATRTNKDQGSPHVLIYNRGEDENLSENIGTVINKNKRHYDRINEDDLTKKFEENIDEYFDKYSIFSKIRKFYRKRKRTRRIAWVISPTLIIVIIILASWQISVASQPRLLLAGGGSAKNYIKEECGMDIISYKPRFWIFANMPSQFAWKLLTEETMKDDNDRKYYPICLSAEEAKDSLFLGSRNVSDFKNKGVVVSVLIGYDELVAYCKTPYTDSIIINKNWKDIQKLICSNDTILCNKIDSLSQYYSGISNLLCGKIKCCELNTIITDTTNKIELYATSMKSGTRDAYIDSNKANIQLLEEEKTAKGESIKLFTDNDPIIDSNNYFIVLGSKYYKPSGGLSKAKPLIVTDSNGNPIKKPIYLFFMAYKSGEEYVIKDEIGTFLDEIEKNRISKKEKPQLKDHISKKLDSIKTNDTIFIVKDTLLNNTK